MIFEILRSIENIHLCAELGHAKVIRDLQRKVVIWATDEQLTSRAVEAAFRLVKRHVEYLTWDQDRRTRLRQGLAVARKVIRNWTDVAPVDQRAFIANTIPASTIAARIEKLQRKRAKTLL